METSRANARKAILSLLSSLPTDAASMWRTADELTALLKRGGASASLESDLVTSALRYADQAFKEKYDTPRREKINDKQCCNYRFIKSIDSSSPAKQREGRGGLPTIPCNYFQNDEHQPHLDSILKYYSDKNSSGGRSSTPIANATDHPNITGVQLNGKRIVVEIKQLYDFVHNLHRSCGNLYLSAEPVRRGFGVTFEWQCDRCNQPFSFCTWIGQRSEVVCPGRKHSRTQAGMNLELMEAAEDEAMYASRFMNFCTKADIVHPTEKNARQVEKKCRAAAIETADEIIDENRAKAYAASSKTVEFERGGEMHTAAVVTVAQDGSALKRDYGHCYTGSAAAVFAVDKETGLVVDKRISQASCHYCVRAYNARLRERRKAGNPMTPSELSNMSKDEILALYDHDGICYRNSSYSPGVAEEHLAEHVGRNLLVDDEGSVQACPLFVEKHVADGDSKGITRAAAAQEDIVGDELASGVELCRDFNHLSNSIDSGFRKVCKGVENFNAIPRPRINRMKQDISKISDRYKHSVLDQPDGAVSEEERQSHLKLLEKELQSVVRHQCGIHTFCTTNTCDWIRLSIAHPDWSGSKLDEEWSSGNQFDGEILEISDDTIRKMTLEITKRINKNTADSNCKKESTTGVEQLNGMVTKQTMGKRLNLTASDAYPNATSRAAGHKSRGTEFNERVLEKLGSMDSPTRKDGFDAIDRKLEGDLARKRTDEYKKSKSDSKRLRAALRNRSEKDDKDYLYKKNRALAAGKAKPAKPGRKKKIDQQCQKCKQLGHTRADCQYDDADDVVVYAGKKRRSPGSNKKSARNSKKAKTNFGVSANDISSWMPSILRENGSL